MSSKLLKIRIANGPRVAMGPGKADLLEAIMECGSISSAAKKMKMSYRRAWELVDMMNRCFDSPLVVGSQGGVHGGGAAVSELGLLVLHNYRSLQRKTEQASKAELDAILSHLSS